MQILVLLYFLQNEKVKVVLQVLLFFYRESEFLQIVFKLLLVLESRLYFENEAESVQRNYSVRLFDELTEVFAH
jgi:hypothetical protein